MGLVKKFSVPKKAAPRSPEYAPGSTESQVVSTQFAVSIDRLYLPTWARVGGTNQLDW